MTKLVKYKELKKIHGNDFLDDINYTPCEKCEEYRDPDIKCPHLKYAIFDVDKMHNLKDDDLICELWITEA